MGVKHRIFFPTTCNTSQADLDGLLTQEVTFFKLPWCTQMSSLISSPTSHHSSKKIAVALTNRLNFWRQNDIDFLEFYCDWEKLTLFQKSRNAMPGLFLRKNVRFGDQNWLFLSEHLLFWMICMKLEALFLKMLIMGSFGMTHFRLISASLNLIQIEGFFYRRAFTFEVVNHEHSLSWLVVLEDPSETCDILHDGSKLEKNFSTLFFVANEFENLGR